jgi:hypothetical protein
MDSPSRRAILKSLTIGAAAGSVLRVIPLQAAEYAHRLIDDEKSAAPAAYTPKFFDPHQYKTLQALCETILPADADSAGAIEAGAPEFIDLLTSENTDYQKTLGDGLKWLDSTCTTRYGKAWLDCTPGQQAEVLDSIAYLKNARQDKTLEDPVEFFSFLRNFTADGFFTSKIGIKYLGYKGNTFLTEFPGCPPVPGL